MSQDTMQIARRFALEAQPVEVTPLGAGFINDTFVIKTAPGSPDYILQRKNKAIFPDVPAMMDNIERVTAHLRAKSPDPRREVLQVVRTKEDDRPYYRDEQGEYWAVCRYIDGAVTYHRATTPELAFKGGQGIGRFQTLLADFPPEPPLAQTIKGFHDMRHRLQQWDASKARARRERPGRYEAAREWVEFVDSRRGPMMEFQQAVESGRLPRRVTHNDTKISNILFDEQGEVMAVIDLDTVMSSTSLNDYGDAIRSYCNTGAEDDPQPERVALDMPMFEAYTRGYLGERRSTLVDEELRRLAFSALFITYEQVLRFLMDYLDGDTYYKTAYEEHNLVRTVAQAALLRSMEARLQEMEAFIAGCR